MEEMEVEVEVKIEMPMPATSTHSSSSTSSGNSGYHSENTSEPEDGLVPDSSYQDKGSGGSGVAGGPEEIGGNPGEERPDVDVDAEGLGQRLGDVSELITDPQPAKNLTTTKTSVIVERLVGTSVLEQIIQSQYPIDILLSCRDGKVGAHRVVLVAASPFLKYLLKDHRLGEVASLILPDIDVNVMTLILHLCYNGQVVFPPELVHDITDGLEYLMIGAGALGDFSIRKVKVIPDTEQSDDPPVEDVASTSTSTPVSEQQPIQPPNEVEVEETSKPLPAVTCTSPSPSHQDEDPDAESGTGETETESEEEEDEFEDNPDLKKTVCAVVSVRPDTDGDGYCYHCTTCDLKILTKCSVPIHMKTHGQEMRWEPPSLEDNTTLSYCPVCNIHHPSVCSAEECLKKHDMARCYTCFAIFKYDEWAAHYKKVHGMKSKHGWVARCRWCDLAVVISNTGQLLRRHARFSHISKVGHPKKFKIAAAAPPQVAGAVPVAVAPIVGNCSSKHSTKDKIQIPTSGSIPNKTRNSRTSMKSSEAAATAPASNNPPPPTATTFLVPLPPDSLQKKTSTSSRRSSLRGGGGVVATSGTGSLLPFLKKFKENVAKRRAEDDKLTSDPSPNANNNLPPTKKRKLDEHGKPLQLGKRRGVPVGKRRKMLTPSMKFNTGTFLLDKDATTGRISSQKINELPKVQVHIEILSESFLHQYSKDDETILDLQDLPSSSADVQPTPEPHPQQSPTINGKDIATKISEADTQLISDPFEATKTVRTE